MLETPAGIANADAIAAVPGVDMLLIGANDLSAEMGIAGDLRHARLREAFAAAAAACKAHHKVLGVGGVRGDLELQTELSAGRPLCRRRQRRDLSRRRGKRRRQGAAVDARPVKRSHPPQAKICIAPQ